MEFTLFQDLFGRIDDVTRTYVTNMATNATTAIAPVVAVGLSLTFIAFGLLIIRGGVQMPVMEFLGKAIKIGLITGAALGGGFYAAQIAEVIRTTPDLMAGLLVAEPNSSPQQASALVDQAAQTGFDKANEAFEKMSWMDPGQGLIFMIFGFIVIIATVAFVAIGGAFLLLAKLGLAILAGVGPLFIVAMLWQPTSKLFEAWVGQVINYGIMVVLLAASFGLMLSIFAGFLEGINWGVDVNNLYNVGGLMILTIAMGIVLLQLPGIASGLGAGASVGYLYELRALASGAKATVSAPGQAVGGARAAAGAAVSGVRSAGSVAAKGASGAMNYYKGRRAA